MYLFVVGICAHSGGKLYAAPLGATSVLEIDPFNHKVSTLGGAFNEPNSYKCICEGPDGKLYASPYDATHVIQIDVEEKFPQRKFSGTERDAILGFRV